MEIKGYTPPNEELAAEKGVPFSFPVMVEDDAGNSTEYTFNFVAKYSGAENKGFQRAAEKVGHKREIRAKTNYKQTTDDALVEMLELWHDNIIVSWNCDVLDAEGNAIENTRENFIALLSMSVFVGVYLALQNGCGDYTKFSKKAEALAAKN